MGNLVKKTASCQDMLAWFEQNGQVVGSPRPGDIVFYKYSTNNRRTNHVGLVYSVRSNDSFSTIEGNTSVNSNDNGGKVMLRDRTRKNVVAFARPKYQSGQVNRLLAIANGEVGISEYPPNSNNVKYNTWYYGHAVSGANYPWCAVFISYIFNLLEGGSQAPTKPTNEKPILDNKPVLRRGSKGDLVELVQSMLVLKGYVIAVDGDFGPNTEAAIKDFQNKNHLKPDGIIGPLTWDALLKK